MQINANQPPDKLTTETTCARYEPLVAKLVTEFQERFVTFLGHQTLLTLSVTHLMGSQRTFASLQLHVEMSMLHLNWKLLICRRTWNGINDSNRVKLSASFGSWCHKKNFQFVAWLAAKFQQLWLQLSVQTSFLCYEDS